MKSKYTSKSALVIVAFSLAGCAAYAPRYSSYSSPPSSEAYEVSSNCNGARFGSYRGMSCEREFSDGTVEQRTCGSVRGGGVSCTTSYVRR